MKLRANLRWSHHEPWEVWSTEVWALIADPADYFFGKEASWSGGPDCYTVGGGLGRRREPSKMSKEAKAAELTKGAG